VTFRIPGKKRASTKQYKDRNKMFKDAMKMPVGTTIWVMIQQMNIGYGLEVHQGGWIY
jgi:hypothetical protein